MLAPSDLRPNILGPIEVEPKMQDDLIIGGDNQREAAHNYKTNIYKLFLANIKVEPEETKIIPECCDITSWVWRKGGILEASLHRKSSILNTRQDHVTKLKHLRSFIGLYKTLHMATPAIS